MINFNTVLNDAQKLPPEERLRLIDALWESVPADADISLHESWAPELAQRVAAIKAGTSQTVPWETVRAEALARIGHGEARKD